MKSPAATSQMHRKLCCGPWEHAPRRLWDSPRRKRPRTPRTKLPQRRGRRGQGRRNGRITCAVRSANAGMMRSNFSLKRGLYFYDCGSDVLEKYVYPAALVLVSLSACSSSASDPTKGPVILQCDGQQTNTVFESNTQPFRETFKIDGKAKTFEIWNTETETWKTWGSGRVEIDKGSITYVGTISAAQGSATRTIAFDRNSGRVTDELDVLPIGNLSFEGICKPVSKVESVTTKF